MYRCVVVFLITAVFVLLLAAFGAATSILKSLAIIVALVLLLVLAMWNKNHGPEYPKDYQEYRGCAVSTG